MSNISNQDQSIDQQISKSEFLEMWNLYQQSKQSTSSPTTFDVNTFVNYIYDQSLRNPTQTKRKFSKDDIDKFLEYPEKFEAALRDVSKFLYNSSQEYKNLTRYYSKMLTFDCILIPDNINPDIYSKENSDKLLKSFYKNLQFIQDYNIKYKLRKIVDVLVKEDFWFGYELSDGENYVWKQLQSNYCRLSGLDEYETYTFEFDFTYFNRQNIDINTYPDEFKTKYRLYKSNGDKYRWQQLDNKKAICFKFDESVLYSLPIFSAMFDELFRLEDLKEVQQDNDKLNNYKLLHQKIPMDEKTGKVNNLLIDATSAAKFHSNVRANVPKGIGVVTTPMEVSGIVLKNNNNAEEDIVAKNMRNTFTSAGVSRLLFSSDVNGSIGLNRSIEQDATIMFSLLRQFEVWFRKKLKLINNKKFKWKIQFLDVTYYNRKEKIEETLKLGQFGLPKFFISSSLGITQGDLISLNNLENDQLNILENMTPLSSSHVQDGNGSGRPNSDENGLSDTGIKTKDTNGNSDRSK